MRRRGLMPRRHWTRPISSDIIGLSDIVRYSERLVMPGPEIRETSKMGKRGTIVIPARLRRRFGLAEGTLVIAEESEEGILLRPAVALAVEHYSPERVAEFLLTNAVDAEEYARAVATVREMGLNPEATPHTRPG